MQTAHEAFAGNVPSGIDLTTAAALMWEFLVPYATWSGMTHEQGQSLLMSLRSAADIVKKNPTSNAQGTSMCHPILR
jgi:hypothetical protein